MNSRFVSDFMLNLYDKGPKNQEWTQKQENIEQIIQKIKKRNLLKQMHIIQYETQEYDPLLKRSQKLNKKLEEYDHFYEEQLETYRKNLQSEREQLQNTISQRKRQGSFVKHVRSISTTALKPLIQFNNIVNPQQNDKKQSDHVVMRQHFKSIQENKQTLENCSKRLTKLFQEDSSAQASRAQSRIEQRAKRKKNSIDCVRHVY